MPPPTTSPADVILVLMMVLNLGLLASHRMIACMEIVSLQGIAVGSIPFLTHAGRLDPHIVFMVILVALLKGVVFPLLMLQTLERLHVQREVEPFVGPNASLLAGILGLALGLRICERLPLPAPVISPFGLPVAFATVFAGLFVIVTRKKALTQVMGYLTLENGIYAAACLLVREGSLVVELGILLDLLVAVFIMGIAIMHIQSEFATTDVTLITELKG